MHDNEVKNNNNNFSMKEVFKTTDSVIWQELENKENIISYKRELQKMQINMYSKIISQ